MENKIGLYRILIDASCTIFRNLKELSPLLDDSALDSVKTSLRAVISSAHSRIYDALYDSLKDIDESESSVNNGKSYGPSERV